MKLLSASVAMVYCLLLSCTTSVKNGDVVLEPVATFSGRVLDHATGKALAGVSISTTPEGGFATTNSDGEYVLVGALVPGRAYHLDFERSGYIPFALEGVGALAPGETRFADVSMERARAKLVIRGQELLLGPTTDEAAFSIANDGDQGEVVSYSINNTEPWLTVTPQTGDVVDAPAVVTLRVDRLLLGTNWGVYTTTLDIVSNAGASSVTIRLVHQPAELGVITAQQTLLDYGGVDRARTVRLDNPGGQPVSWELAAIPSYLTTVTGSGTVGAGNFLLLEVQLNRGALLPGTYVAEVRLNTNSEILPQIVIAVRFEVPPRLSVALTTAFLDLGDSFSARAFGIVNDGNLAFEYEVAWPAPWDSGDPRTCSQRPRISTNPKSGVLAPGGTASVGVHLDRAGLLPGEVTKPIVVRILREGAEVEQRTVTVRYVVKPKANITATLERNAFTRLNGTATLKVQLTASSLDPCDMLANVPVEWTATLSDPWFIADVGGGLLEMPIVPGGVIDSTAAPIGYLNLKVDWPAVPRIAGSYASNLVVSWCSPTPGLGFTCGNGTPHTVTIPITVTQPGPQIERAASWILPNNAGFSAATVAAYNPFGNRLLMGPSFIGFQNAGYYWLEWDLTPGAEIGYRVDIGTLPNSWSPADTPVDQRGLSGDSGLVYDWAHDVYVFIWTLYRSGVPSTYTWVYENAAWRMVTPMEGGIPGIRKANLFYDTKRSKVLLYGGYIDELTPDDTLREFDLATGTWSVVTTALIGTALDVTRTTMIYDASQDRYLAHGGKPLLTNQGHTVRAVERTWGINPDTLEVTRLTPVSGYNGTEAWGRELVHNVEQNITYVMGGFIQTGANQPYEGFADRTLHVLFNEGAAALPIPPLDQPMVSGTTDNRVAPNFFHLTYDPTFDRMLFTGTAAAPDPVTGVEILGAGAWQLIYSRTAPLPPTLAVSGSYLLVEPPTPGAFHIVNRSGSLSAYRITPINSWISVDRLAGYIPDGGDQLILVNVDTSDLASGTHVGTIRIEGAGKQVFQVRVEVTKP